MEDKQILSAGLHLLLVELPLLLEWRQLWPVLFVLDVHLHVHPALATDVAPAANVAALSATFAAVAAAAALAASDIWDLP